MDNLINYLMNKFNVNTTRENPSRPYYQDQSTLNVIPLELQLLIFSYLSAKQLTICALVSKEWKNFTNDSILWKNLGLKVGLTQFSEKPKSDYQFAKPFSTLQLKEKFGEDVFNKLQELPVWEESMDFKCSKGDFSNGVYSVYELTKKQKEEDNKDYSGKKLIGDELIFIFVKANRLESKIIRFNLNFNPKNFTKDEYLCWSYGFGGGCSGFCLNQADTEQKRNYELATEWISLKKTFSELLGLTPKKAFDFDAILQGAYTYYFERDFLQLDKPQNQ